MRVCECVKNVCGGGMREVCVDQRRVRRVRRKSVCDEEGMRER